MTVRQVIAHVERLAPPRLAMEGDPIGLAVGDPAATVQRVMVSLDAGPFTLRQAAKGGAQLLISHHPLLFRPLASIDPRSGTGEAVALALSHKIAVYSAHTNLDASPGGMNRGLATLLGLRECRVLEASPSRLFKLVVFVPRTHRDRVKDALFAAGGGRIGAYDRCSFSAPGEGSFRPGPGTSPAVGRPGRQETVPEDRLETVVEERAVAAAVEAARGAHPYEEPAIDVIPLRATGQEEGIGLVGELASPALAGDLASALARPLGLESVRVVGDPQARVSRVAVCAGSGGSLMEAAIGQGAQMYVTGDVGYHHARRAEEAGLLVCDLGHFPPERFGMERFARALGRSLRTSGAAVEVVLAKEKDPFSTYIPGAERGGERTLTRRKRK